MHSQKDKYCWTRLAVPMKHRDMLRRFDSDASKAVCSLPLHKQKSPRLFVWADFCICGDGRNRTAVQMIDLCASTKCVRSCVRERIEDRRKSSSRCLYIFGMRSKHPAYLRTMLYRSISLHVHEREERLRYANANAGAYGDLTPNTLCDKFALIGCDSFASYHSLISHT